MKTISLLKAVFSQDMNMFNFSVKKDAGKLKRKIFPISLFVIVFVIMGIYAFEITDMLKSFNLTHAVLSLFSIFTTIIIFIGGISKSQEILFDAKDNDLLFSLPIKKSQILFVRLLKLLTFEYLNALMFLLPAIIAYIYYEKTSVVFYLISFLMTLLIPIIPTIISGVLGYIVKLISSKFKLKKVAQTIGSIIVFVGVMYVTMNLNINIKAENIEKIISNINNTIIEMYYPIKLYINLIFNFRMLDLIKLLTINIIPLVIFVLLGIIFYFKIIARSKETAIKTNKKIKKQVITRKTPLMALIIKELKRYFSSPIYMFNTGVGLITSVILPIFMCLKREQISQIFMSRYYEGTSMYLPALFYMFVLFTGTMTEITASSISLEGKTINITKSLPVSEKTILKSKILTCFIIELPFLLISDLIFIISFKINILYSLLILILSFVIVQFMACIGIIINLKYPKMNSNNDTEVVKQSTSSVITMFVGIIVLTASIALIVYLSEYIKVETVLILHIILLAGITEKTYEYLMENGPKEYKEINV